MAATKPRRLLEYTYEMAAREYQRNLPPEHYMEATPQATQREITLESFALIKARRRDFQSFNELLVQYPKRGTKKLGQVCPDNMVVLSDQPINALGSYNLPLEPAPPFWMLEYVSKNIKRKDYEDNFDEYEKELKVPYYLTYYPDNQELILYRHTGKEYVTVKPNDQGRYAIPELDLELALHDCWVRYWYQGKFLPLPADLQNELDQARRQIEEEKRRVKDAQLQAEEAKRHAAAATRRADEATRQAEEAMRQAEVEKRRATEFEQQLQAAQAELAQLRGSPGSSSSRRSNGAKPKNGGP